MSMSAFDCGVCGKVHRFAYEAEECDHACSWCGEQPDSPVGTCGDPMHHEPNPALQCGKGGCKRRADRCEHRRASPRDADAPRSEGATAIDKLHLKRLSDLREWLRNGNAYMEHPDGQDGTVNAVDSLDAAMSVIRHATADARPSGSETERGTMSDDMPRHVHDVMADWKFCPVCGLRIVWLTAQNRGMVPLPDIVPQPRHVDDTLICPAIILMATARRASPREGEAPRHCPKCAKMTVYPTAMRDGWQCSLCGWQGFQEHTDRIWPADAPRSEGATRETVTPQDVLRAIETYASMMKEPPRVYDDIANDAMYSVLSEYERKRARRIITDKGTLCFRDIRWLGEDTFCLRADGHSGDCSPFYNAKADARPASERRTNYRVRIDKPGSGFAEAEADTLEEALTLCGVVSASERAATSTLGGDDAARPGGERTTGSTPVTAPAVPEDRGERAAPTREQIMDAILTPKVIDELRAECDRLPDSEHPMERLREAREALARVAVPSSPDQDKDRLYYPLLFLCESVEPVLRWLNDDKEPLTAGHGAQKSVLTPGEQ